MSRFSFLFQCIFTLNFLLRCSFGVGGELEFLHKAMKKYSSDHEMWCYQGTNCKQGSVNSSWERGLCKHGSSQSPINLEPRLIVSAKGGKNLNFFMRTRRLYNLMNYKIEHKGHTVVLIPPDNHNIFFEWPEKHGGVYRFNHIDFHWGPTNQVGSEHSIDRKSYAMEMHLVHYRIGGPVAHQGYSNIEEAVLSGDRGALAVIGILLHVDYRAEKASFLDSISSKLPLISREGDRTYLHNNSFLVGNILMNENQAFTYQGSLTTPPCTEIVAWLILRHPVNIMEREVVAFRNVSIFMSRPENNLNQAHESSTHRKLQRTISKNRVGKINHIHVRLIDLKN